MKTFIAMAACAAVLAAPAALAGEPKTFAQIDTNANGTLSLAEVQAAKPSVTAEAFATYDSDANGELTLAEYDAWKAAKTTAKEPAKKEY